MSSVSKNQAQLIDDLAFIEDRHERLAAVAERARRHPPLPEASRTDANRVHGCISQVWVTAELREGVLHFAFDADSPLVKGLVALLIDLYEGGEPADIVSTEPVLFEQLGISRDLTPTRQNGLAAVRARIKSLARSFLP